ncbi:MAG: TetR/AcrR family transcriptional regulator [Dongiaceae bacterium]
MGKLRRNDGIRSEELLETALALFSSVSFADVTVQDIARRVGITHSLIYYYYESKEKLFHAAVLHAIDRVMEQYNKVTAEHRDPIDLLNDWFEINIAMSGPLRSVVRIMIEYSDRDPKRASPSVQRVIRQFYDFERRTIADSIRRGVAAGRFTCADPERLAIFVSRGIDGVFYGHLVRKDADIATEMKELRAILWRLLDYKPR